MKTDTNIRTGLTDKEVLKSKQLYGENRISKIEKPSFFKNFLETLGDPIIKILLIALAIKTIFLIKDFDWYETVGIVIAIFLASFISTISEYGSEQAFSKLQEEASKIKCRVRRNGQIIEINIDEVVVGDVVLLESGDKIPADGVLVNGEITVDESSLNGEAKEQYKYPLNGIVKDENNLYRGTVVYSKRGIMIVTSIGDQTIYGKLASELSEAAPDSPLKLRLRHLAKIISIIGYVGAILVSLSYLFSVIFIDNNFDMKEVHSLVSNFPLLSSYILHALTLSVTIIVVAVPEGLPMMITLVLSSNMKRMLKNNVLVRKMTGIETAGSLNILFSDKTGTITKGKLEVIGLMDGELNSYHTEYELQNLPRLHNLFKKSLICNNASTYDENGNPIGGNITDRALLNFIKTKSVDYQKLETIPFNSKDKFSVTKIKDIKEEKLIKGAPEVILKHCTSFYDKYGKKRRFYDKDKYQNKINSFTKQGIRVLALAINDNYDLNNTFLNLTLVGIVLIKDEVRKEAIEGIKLVNKAHIQTVMITGDNKDTAFSIGKEVGLIKNNNDLILTSDELKTKSDDEIKKILPYLRIVARALPQDKSRLVKIAQDLGLVVGMTGDGVNDAPALKKADVGFSMGSGTEVAKEASDIVILDDNFLSISKAILFGRTIFKSIRKFIIFQLTVNMCAISLSIIGPFIGVDTPVTVIQMLWINMVMDTLAGLAFSFEPPLLEYMDEYPKKRDEKILNKYMLHEILFTGSYSSLLCVFFLKNPFIHSLFRNGVNDEYFMTAFFGLFIFIGIFNCFNARTNRLNLLSNLLKNRIFLATIIFIFIVQLILIYYGGDLFRTAGLTLKELEIMIVIAFTVIPIDWFRKIFLRSRGYIGGV